MEKEQLSTTFHDFIFSLTEIRCVQSLHRDPDCLDSPRRCLCDFVHSLTRSGELNENDLIRSRFTTWAGQRAGLGQNHLLVSVHGQLQAAAQLLVHRAALAVAGAVRHEAGQVPVAGAVSAHHTLSGRRGRGLLRRDVT